MRDAVKIKKILVIRFRRVGDAVLGTAICTSLRKSFPDAQIDYVLNENIASLYDGHPDIDNIIGFSDRENASILSYVAKVWRTMRVNKYDVIIDTRSTVRTLLFSLFSLGTPYRIGTLKRYNFLLHNFRIDNHRDRSRDMVSNNLMLLNPLEQVAKIHYCTDFPLYVSVAEQQKYRTYMEQQGINFLRPVILVAVTARQLHKVWPKEKMKVVLSKIIDKFQAQIIFNFAGAREEAFACELWDEMGRDESLFVSVRANSLRELCALTVNCDFFFGNEGGPRHISQALNIPSFAIYPPGPLKSVWLPQHGLGHYQGISPNDICEPSELEEMNYQQRFDLISVDQVWAGLEPMLIKHLLNK